MAKTQSRIKLRSAHSAPTSHNDYQVLVDATWPRGIRKEDLPLDAWMKDLAPSTALRRWFRAHREQWDEFCRRYFAELKRNAAWTVLAKVLRDRSVTILYTDSDSRHNHAVALKEFIETQLAEGRESRLDIGKDQPTTGGNPPGTEKPPRRARRSMSERRTVRERPVSKTSRTHKTVRARAKGSR